MRYLGHLFIIGTLILPLGCWAEQLVIGGSGVDLSTFRLLATAFREQQPGISIRVKPSVGSSGGVRAVNDKLFHLGLLSRPPTRQERSAELVYRHYATTPMVFAVSRESPIDGISTRQAADIYAGRLTQWPDGTPARPILRPASDSDTRLLVESLPHFRQAMESAYQRKSLPVAITDQDSADKITRIKGAIGTSTLALIKTEQISLRPLKLDGIDPTATTGASTYPLNKALYFVYRKDHKNPALQDFIEYLDSVAARQLLSETGHRVSDDPSGP